MDQSPPLQFNSSPRTWPSLRGRPLLIFHVDKYKLEGGGWGMGISKKRVSQDLKTKRGLIKSDCITSLSQERQYSNMSLSVSSSPAQGAHGTITVLQLLILQRTFVPQASTL
jgi:hypothetical protein